jgi:conjugative relaxase-like TrwC/TraI family protein
MLSIGPVKSAAAASVYFEKDDYYAKGEGEAPSEWFGRAAELLGLSSSSPSGAGASSGPTGANAGGAIPDGADGKGTAPTPEQGPTVDRDAFRRALAGELPDGTRLGTIRDGELVHRPGWDLTFSAPKSVSIMATIGDDRRLVDAHAEAVRITLAEIEREHATTRLRGPDGKVMEVQTGALAIATFRHETNRNLEPQLHTHAVVLNVTVGQDGTARSLQEKPIFVAQKDLGARYRENLAVLVTSLGYQIERSERDPTIWRLSAVPKALEAAFSSRAREVEAALERRGLTRDTATPREAEMAAKDTRAAKGEVDRTALLETWRRAAAPHLAEAAKVRDAALAHAAAHPRDMGAERAAARLSVTSAIATLSERQAVFSDRWLAATARSLALGRASPAQVRDAIRAAEKEGLLLPRIAVEPDPRSRSETRLRGWTTPEAIATERAMLAAASEGREAVIPLLRAQAAARFVRQAETAAASRGFGWTADQRAAAESLLRGRDRVQAVQGLAGTAKTTTVLATYAAAARARGLDVIALAPTNDAARVLGAAVGATGRTIDSHLMSLANRAAPDVSVTTRMRAWLRGETARPANRQAWIVDESGLVGASRMRDLLESANRHGARVVLVGDVRQIGSVEAGQAFGQLQRAGAVQTFRLETVVRQTTEEGREAVYAALRRDLPAALAALEKIGGQVIADGNQTARWQAVADAWLAKAPQARKPDLVIDPSREGRDAINAAIRVGLKAEGTVRGPELSIDAMRPKGLTVTERGLALSYLPGDVIRFGMNVGGSRQDPDFVRGSYHVVEAVDARAGVLTLRDERGAVRELMPSRLEGRYAAEVLEQNMRGLAAGDTIRWTMTDKARGLQNGQTAEVVSVDSGRGTVEVRLRDGTALTLDPSRMADRHFDHGWAQTAYTAQGSTSPSPVLHAESWRINVVNANALYTMISRMKDNAVIVTDDPAKLAQAIRERLGEKQTALEASPWPGLRAELDRLATKADDPLGEASSGEGGRSAGKTAGTGAGGGGSNTRQRSTDDGLELAI